MDADSETEDSPPATVDAYIQDMLGQLAQLAAARGRTRLAERIRDAAQEAARELA